jgi:hypothetical protein
MGFTLRVLVGGYPVSRCSFNSGLWSAPRDSHWATLILIHISDLPEIVSSQVRLVADRCLLYRKIRSLHDQLQLQKDLKSLLSFC